MFDDAGVTGRTHRREGLQKMLACLDCGEVDVVIALTTNRLARKVHVALRFVEEQIVEKRRRAVFVTQNIDTANTKSWRQLLHLHAMTDEMQAEMTAGHVKAAHVGLMRQGKVWGTMAFGYRGSAIDGTETRRGKRQRRVEVDPELAQVVREVYNWFTEEELTFQAIARRLRERGVAPPPKVSRWTWRAVRRVLSNRRYIGDWSYGRTETVWQSSAGYGRQLELPAPQQEHREERLRIVEDVLFLRAQERVARYHGRGGRRRPGTDGPPHLLHRLLWCETHRRHLIVCGHNATRLQCPQCRKLGKDAPLFNSVGRRLTEQLLCRRLAEAIEADDDLVGQIVRDTQEQAAAAMTRPSAAERHLLERQIAAVKDKVEFVLEAPGETEEDRAENRQRLAVLRAERANLQAELAELARAEQAAPAPPTQDEVRAKLADMEGVLQRAMVAVADPAAQAAARRVVRELTGGRIAMSQRGQRASKAGWLSGRFVLRLVGSSVIPVEIDFRRPSQAEELADRAMAMIGDGLPIKQVALELGVHRNAVAGAVKAWHREHGLSVPDYRTVRATFMK